MNPEIHTVWQKWRTRVLNIATISTFAVCVPLVAYILLSDALQSSIFMTVGFVTGTLLLGIAAVFRKLSNHTRAVLWMAAGYLAASIAFMRMGMAGSGRLFVMAMPFIAFFLSGYGLGRVTAVISVLFFSGLLILCGMGYMDKWIVVRENSTEIDFWIVQLVTWAMIFIPLVVIIDRFLHLQVRTIGSERAANEKLKIEIQKRVEAHENLLAAMSERKRLENEILEIAERERRHLGHELHDGVCQLLTGMRLRCSVMEKELIGTKPSLTNQFGTMKMLLDDALDQTYELARGLSPGKKIEQEDLLGAIDEYVRKVREVYDVRCEFNIIGETYNQLAGPVSVQVLRIVQEAVTNSLKHANATLILISVSNSESECEISVKDNGVGFPQEEYAERGMGIGIMKYRANTIGATVTVNSESNKGVTVRCIVPLRLNIRGEALNEAS